MKAIKYLFVGALLVLFSAPAMAQDEEQAIIDNITRVIKNNKGGNYETIEDEVDRVRKKNKKKPHVLTAMGVAFKENTFHMMTTGIIKQCLAKLAANTFALGIR